MPNHVSIKLSQSKILVNTEIQVLTIWNIHQISFIDNYLDGWIDQDQTR